LAELNPAPCAFALLNIAKVDSIIGGSQEEVLKNSEKAKAVFTNLQYPFGMTACNMPGQTQTEGGEVHISKHPHRISQFMLGESHPIHIVLS
jgi:hypothetical protein